MAWKAGRIIFPDAFIQLRQVHDRHAKIMRLFPGPGNADRARAVLEARLAGQAEGYAQKSKSVSLKRTRKKIRKTRPD
jgi:hypothetical protein